MKKYIQACELGGSIYGRKRKKGEKRGLDILRMSRKEFANDYSDLYRRQVAILGRLFRRRR